MANGGQDQWTLSEFANQHKHWGWSHPPTEEWDVDGTMLPPLNPGVPQKAYPDPHASRPNGMHSALGEDSLRRCGPPTATRGPPNSWGSSFCRLSFEKVRT